MIRKLRIAFFLVIAGILTAPNAFAGERLLVVGAEFAPFEFSMEGEVGGIDVDIATSIFKKMGIDFEIKMLDWDKAWSMIEKGEAEACFTTSRKKKREPFLFYPEEDMWVSEYVFFVRNDKKGNKISGYSDAKNMTIGVIKGYSYNQAFWDAKLKTVEFADVNECFKGLAEGKVDLMPMDKIVGNYTLKLLGLQGAISSHGFTLFSKGYPMPFAKKSDYPGIEKIAQDFDHQLKALKESGEYDKILERWIMLL